MALTDIAIRNAKPGAKQIKFTDSGGVKLITIDRDSHALGGFVDFDQQVGVGDFAKRQHRGGDQRSDEAVSTHEIVKLVPWAGFLIWLKWVT